jgi:hypothetical protein
MTRPGALVLMALSLYITVIDTKIMNASIPALVLDPNTTVSDMMKRASAPD